jgi:hypothetical protein
MPLVSLLPPSASIKEIGQRAYTLAVAGDFDRSNADTYKM